MTGAQGLPRAGVGCESVQRTASTAASKLLNQAGHPIAFSGLPLIPFLYPREVQVPMFSHALSRRLVVPGSLATTLFLTCQVSQARDFWVSCEACSSQQASAAAAEAPDPMASLGTQTDVVHVLDPLNRSVRKYEVTTIFDPVSYKRSAQELAVRPSTLNAFQRIWAEWENLSKLDIPADRSPSAVDYLANPFYTGRANYWVDEGADGFMAAVNAAGRVVNLTTVQVLPAFGADRGPLVLTLMFADGSRLNVQVEFGVDGESGAPSIVSIKVVDRSAYDGDGNPLPTSAAQFGGLTVPHADHDFITAL